MEQVLEVVRKGVAIAQVLIEQSQPAVQALQAIGNLLDSAREGTVTDDEIAETRAVLDKLIDEFNVEIPE